MQDILNRIKKWFACNSKIFSLNIWLVLCSTIRTKQNNLEQEPLHSACLNAFSELFLPPVLLSYCSLRLSHLQKHD